MRPAVPSVARRRSCPFVRRTPVPPPCPPLHYRAQYTPVAAPTLLMWADGDRFPRQMFMVCGWGGGGRQQLAYLVHASRCCHCSPLPPGSLAGVMRAGCRPHAHPQRNEKHVPELTTLCLKDCSHWAPQDRCMPTGAGGPQLGS